MGCRVVPYWLGTFIFDYSIFLVTIILFSILCITKDLSYIMNDFGYVFFILISFGAMYITTSYFWGFMFKKASDAMKFFPLFSLLVIYSGPWMITGPLFSTYKNGRIGIDTYNVINGIF